MANAVTNWGGSALAVTWGSRKALQKSWNLSGASTGKVIMNKGTEVEMSRESWGMNAWYLPRETSGPWVRLRDLGFFFF